MEDHGKRKVKDSSQEDASHRKARRLSAPGTPVNNITQILNSNGPKGSDLTQKLVSIWLNEAKSHDTQRTKEQENSTTDKNQRTCTKAEKDLIERMQQNVQHVENQMRELLKELESEKKANNELVEKIDSTVMMVTTIVDHVNCTGDVLERSRAHTDKLSNIHDTVILKQREELITLKDHSATLNKQIDELQNEISFLKGNLKELQVSFNNQLNESKAELRDALEERKSVQNQLQEVTKQKEEISSALASREAYELDYKKKILQYEVQVEKLSDKLTKLSADFDVLNRENLKLNNDLTSKNDEVIKLVKELESAKIKYTEKIATVQAENVNLKDKFSMERKESEDLKQKLKETIEMKEKFARQLEHLRAHNSVEIEELTRNLENAESGKKEIYEMQQKIINEMEKRYKDHVKKYERLIVEMKELEERHQEEMARANESSNAELCRVNNRYTHLENQLESLKREKEDQAEELQQVELLLEKHTNSEMQLKQKLEQCKEEAAALTASVAAAAAYKKAQEAKTKEDATKIKNLEEELLKLKVDKEKSAKEELQKENEDIKKIEAKNKKSSSAKKEESSVQQKSILKNTTKQRKIRSSPSSPDISSKKKITFFDMDSSKASPSIFDDLRSESVPFNTELFDRLTDVEQSPPQLQSSQLPPSQMRTYSLSQSTSSQRKFFKTRKNPYKRV